MTDIELRELKPFDYDLVDGWISASQAIAAHDLPELPVPISPRLRLRLVVPEKFTKYYRTVALKGGTVVGSSTLEHDLENNTHMMWLELDVHPEHRGEGIGARLLEHAEQTARQVGVRTLMAEVAYNFAPAPDRVAPGKTFAAKHGYTVGQETIHRTKDLTFNEGPELQELYDAACAKSEGYEVLTWSRTIPNELIEGYCYLKGRMVTDSPMGDLDFEKEEFSVERIRSEEKSLLDRGSIWLGAFARHKETGQAAGFTETHIMLGDEEHCYIGDTIVDPDHRGHRLGARLKVVNERQLSQWRPSMRYIHTWNADTNGYMISVNEELGYRVYCTDQELQKKL
ncbi:GNAT family N-acetyltransferase [Natronoglycomyces albus]|uniref:GNAT family N-acetyltransferase n=1 Tax=Natronoglycomyces albus TaxID=2811108 RepID=A0A895XQF1_9ACTN|nr:GNAT family N-acetyltransferase [Natronoglycomyces albus]QSB05599.1 GNAT family N-acetyltransferase [Natronoglycomyces albus]